MFPFTRKILKDWAGPQVFREAMMLIDDERVEQVDYDPPTRMISGSIFARPRSIKSSLQLRANGIPDNLCPCRDSREQGILCKHAVALCLDLLKIQSDPERLARLEEEQRRAQRLASVDEQAYLQRVPEGSPGAVPAELQLELAANWREEVQDEERLTLRVFLAAPGGGADRRDIDSWPLEIPVVLSEPEDNLLFVLEDICEGPARAELKLSLRDFFNLLDLLHGRMLAVEGGAPILVQGTPVDARLMLDLDRENGELILMMDTPLPGLAAGEFPFYLVKNKQGWVFGAQQLWKLSHLLPDPLHAIYRKPMFVQRSSVPQFLKAELEALKRVVEIDTDISPDLFTLEPGEPKFELTVRGSLASLAATLHAEYDGIRLIAGRPDSQGDFALPDPEDLMAYKVRNTLAELRAVERLSHLGFDGTVGDDFEAIVGRRDVLRFVGTTLPMLRRQGWKVLLQGRIADFLEDDADFVTPVVRVDRASGGGGGEGGWFDVGFDFEAGQGESLTSAEIHRAIRMGDSHVERNGKIVLFDSDAISDMNQVFADCATGEAGRAGAFRMSGIHSAYVKSSLDGLDGIDVEATPDWMRSAESQNRTLDLQPADIPEPLKSQLRSYQREGVDWLSFLEQNGFCGILADEMGLGKTLQTLTWIQLPRRNKELQSQPVLIVCPTSLVENWIEEGERWTPNLRFLNLTGSDRAQRWEKIDEADILVTSYAVIRRDLEKYLAREFSIMVLDEAQHIKNRSTQNSQAVKSLHARHRLVLTGTPVENGVADLWSIMDFLMPGYLGGHEHFRGHYELPIGQGGAEAEDAQRRLRKKLHPFMLRRLKRDVAKDLPPKIEKIAHCGMTRDQALVYKELVESSRRRLNDLVEEQGFNRSRMEVLKTLLRLRQACCHLELLKLPGLEAKAPSGKLELFMEMMQEAVDGGHRVLVFSQFTSMLAILRRELEAQDMAYCYLDGSTKDRMGQVRKFNTQREIPAFLISLKAGGTGLNLTGADMVIHYDPWWNPAVENQATDRAYRIGQKRTVYSLKLITRNSVEEKVLELQRRKQAVIDATLESDQKVMEKLSWEDVQELLTI